MSRGAQVFVYPEELEHVSPEALAAQVRELGCDGVSMALSYHRGRRVFPRHGRVSNLGARTLYVEPDASRYETIGPPPTVARSLVEPVRRFRAACAHEGIAFRAWVVALHDEHLVGEHPDAASRLLDGSPAGHSLCPSAPETVAFAAALAGDVAASIEPDAVDLEAGLYPAWDPAYTLTLALDPLEEPARLLGAQCFCASCRTLLGGAADELEARTRSAAGPPFSEHAGLDASLSAELAAARARGAARLVEAVADAVHAAGSSLRVFVSGAAAQAELQGASPVSLAAADALLFGCGPLRGDELAGRFDALRALAGRSGTVSTNWSPERTPEAYAADAGALAAAGAEGIALYNLSLVPAEGLQAFAAAAAAFRTAAVV